MGTSAANQTFGARSLGAWWGMSRGSPVGQAEASDCRRRTKAEQGLTTACGVSAWSGIPRSGWGHSGAEPPGAERMGQGNLVKVEGVDQNQFSSNACSA